MTNVQSTRRETLLAAAAAGVARPVGAAETATVRRDYVPAWTGQVHVRLAGARGTGRRPVFCFHPSLASSLYYEQLVADLGRDRLAIAADTPGYGMSDPPPRQPSVADYARAMADAADALDLETFDLVGAHTGSMIAVELALAMPARVKHVSLVTASVHTEADIARLSARNAVEPPDAGGEMLAAAWRRQFERRDPRAGLDDVMHKFPDHLIGGDKRVWGQVAAFSYHMEKRIGDISAPIMVINPGGDLHQPTLRVAQYLANGRVINRTDWGPSFMQYDTAEAAALLRAFFDEDRMPDG